MKNFLRYVEIQTKITSLMTFTLLILVFKLHNIEIQVLETSVFFVSMFIFDLTTTSINNYIDSNTSMEDFGMSRFLMKVIMYSLFISGTLLGLYLVYLTDYFVLLLGAVSFFIGVIYTFGPIALNKQAYGEIVSGVLYGYMIPFILMYINLGAKFIQFDLSEFLNISLNLKYFFLFIIFGLVPTLLTSAIMLGNNLCDLDDDIKVERFTLAFFIGQDAGLKLLTGIYYSVFIAIVVAVVVKIYPIYMIVLIGLLPLVINNAKQIAPTFSKEESFVNVIKNFVLVMMSLIIVVSISLILK